MLVKIFASVLTLLLGIMVTFVFVFALAVDVDLWS
jgi:hypothetical protein